MKPMSEKLLNALEEANFHYDDDKMKKDFEFIDSLYIYDEIKIIESVEEKKKESLISKGKNKLNGLVKKKENKEDPYEKIKKLKELLDMGAITQDEYDEKKKELLTI